MDQDAAASDDDDEMERSETRLSELKSTLCVLAAGVLWGLLPLFVKEFAAAGFSPEQIVFIRVSFGALPLAVWLAVRNPALLRFHLADVWCFAGTGIGSIMLFSYCYFRTIESGSIALAALLLYTSPVFVLFFSILLFGERVTKRKFLAVGCAFAGCVCITGILDGKTDMVSWPVVLLGLSSGVCYALYSIFGKYALRRHSSLTVTVYSLVFAAVGSAFLVPLPRTFALLADPAFFFLACGMALFCTLGSFGLYTLGLRGIAASKAGVLATIEPVVATLLGILVFHEQAALTTFAGMALIIGATLLLAGRADR
ncbi:MAG: DMT family transporter [Candidatus Accumulibacter sp.]|jgi:drug/metabolite transporter (DMT)-like permease|nr:DMT family transporter [Accumulibacter sp.]